MGQGGTRRDLWPPPILRPRNVQLDARQWNHAEIRAQLALLHNNSQWISYFRRKAQFISDWVICLNLQTYSHHWCEVVIVVWWHTATSGTVVLSCVLAKHPRLLLRYLTVNITWRPAAANVTWYSDGAFQVLWRLLYLRLDRADGGVIWSKCCQALHPWLTSCTYKFLLWKI